MKEKIKTPNVIWKRDHIEKMLVNIQGKTFSSNQDFMDYLKRWAELYHDDIVREIRTKNQ